MFAYVCIFFKTDKQCFVSVIHLRYPLSTEAWRTTRKDKLPLPPAGRSMGPCTLDGICTTDGTRLFSFMPDFF